ncbi:MAG: C45 family peptidase [Gemmataceae bacterium]|nr:C45 family peptidase [Gemmataceae bacterium]
MRSAALVALLVVAPAVGADAPKTFPAASHKGGELKYVEGVPVLVMKGTPAEVGEQFGVLAVKNAPDLTGLHDRFRKETGMDGPRAFVVRKAARTLRPNFPPHHLAELTAVAAASGRDEDLLLFADTVADLSSGLGCSTLVVGPDRSSTGGPLFGRNFDWLPTKGITEHTLVAVYKQDGKRAFAAVTVSPITGVISGMNDAGLCVTVNEISLRKSKDQAPFNWKGTPLLLMYRRVLEECATVAEAEKLVRGMGRTTSTCMTVCDRDGGAVFEITPQTVEVRRPENGAVCCTNHFRSDPLSVTKTCWRFDKLAPLCKLEPAETKLGVKDVFARLDDVHQGKATLQSMVFEPRERVLHLAYGDGHATRKDPHKLELGKLFEGK